MQIHVIFCCHNRVEKTKNCILRLIEGNPSLAFHFTVVNDGSTDGTDEVLAELNRKFHCITEVKGDGTLFYSKGMHKGMESLNASGKKADYVLLVNDDVNFSVNAIEKLVSESMAKNDAIIAGATHDEDGNFTYGGAKYKKGTVHYTLMNCEQSDELCDTFNANCVLIPWKFYSATAPMDNRYAHSLGDFDYGFSLRKAGASIYTSSFFVGQCSRNTIKGSCIDKTLSRWERLKLTKSPTKGLPFRSWTHFLYKNFGFGQVLLHGFTPYLKILLG